MFFQAFQTGTLFCFQQRLLTHHARLGRKLFSKIKLAPSFWTALAIVFELEFFFFLGGLLCLWLLKGFKFRSKKWMKSWKEQWCRLIGISVYENKYYSQMKNLKHKIKSSLLYLQNLFCLSLCPYFFLLLKYNWHTTLY